MGCVGAFEVFDDIVGVLNKPLFIPTIVLGDAHEKLRPGDAALTTIFRREVGATEKRPSIWETKDVQGPASVLGEQLYRFHVDMIKIGSLFAVYFDTYEMAVHQTGDIPVIETFVGHDVAPVAGAIADRDQDRLIVATSGFESLWAPRVPVDRIVRVLSQVEAFFS